MTTILPEREVVIIGLGWTGAIMAEQLTAEGLDVLALERGVWRDTSTQYAVTNAQDELRFRYRDQLFEDLSRETLTFRNEASQTALPMRQLGSFLPGSGVGGAGVHWNGQCYRFLPYDFEIKSQTIARYGATKIPENMTIQDWGVTYDELEPYFTQFDEICGLSGQAGNINGQKVEGGNPFEGPRSKPFPNPPLTQVPGTTIFAKAAGELGYHPFPCPAANASRTYTNPLGVTLGQCTYCGFCEKFGCGNYSKASASTTILPVLMRRKNFTLKTQAMVLRILHDGQRATGVEYVTAEGEIFHQPAKLVILCSYAYHNAHMLLVSGIGTPYNAKTGEGVVGKNYAYQIIPEVTAFHDDLAVNPFVGAGALGMVIDDFNGDNFDHSSLDFISGGYIAQYVTNGRPLESLEVPKGTPKFGAGWKKAARENYNHQTTMQLMGAVMGYRENYLDLDPTYKDAWGRPLLRMTSNFRQNEVALQKFVLEKMRGIAEQMNPRAIKEKPAKVPYDIKPYQSTHNTGGAIMGATPKDSVVNKYLQSWDLPNLFVQGSGAFPHNGGYNPTVTLGALTYQSAHAIRTQYLKNPGRLVDA